MNKAELLQKLLARVAAGNPFRSARLMDPATARHTNLLRQALGGAAGYAVSEPLGNLIEEKGLPEGQHLNPVAKMTERGINTILGAYLAGRGNIANNPKLLSALTGKSIALAAPIGVHHGMQFLENSSRTSANVADASASLNAAVQDGTNKGKPGLQVVMESLAGTSEKMEGLMGRAPAAADNFFNRMEKAPVNAASGIMERFGSSASPVVGGVTGAVVGNLLGNALADKARTPEDIRRNDRRQAMLTLALGGLGAGTGWAAGNPEAVTKALSNASDWAGKQMAKFAYTNHNVQTLLPINPRRELSSSEQLDVAQGTQQWIPKIFENLSDSPTVRMASPTRQAQLWGAGVGIPLGLMTAANTQSAGAGLLVGAGAGSLAAILAYLRRKQVNADTVETMRRLPEGSTLRDYDADPLIAERRRFMHENAVADRQARQYNSPV